MLAHRFVVLGPALLILVAAVAACRSPDPYVWEPIPAGPSETAGLDAGPRGANEATGPRAPRTYAGMPLSDVLEGIAREGGVDIDFHAETDPPVTLQARASIEWPELLEAVVESARFRLTRRSPRLFTVRATSRVTAEFHDEEIRNVLLAIAWMGETSVVISEKVVGRVTINLNDSPVREALEAVARTGGYVVIETSTGWSVGAPGAL